MTISEMVKALEKIKRRQGDFRVGIADAGQYSDVVEAFLIISSGDKRGIYFLKERNENERD